ncbi:hypothetical protein EHQ94_18820 [Leptospira meyeri]|uniref:hypothetical protein n=1 Tax=Leptospira meyeri TaxID=29508 RepID=UPI001083539E|nr:hypothetical protein [Leptospira meyeri]TGM64625.1 hypothetical protein EHQ94_18820 [Leptospira meyeri]TGM66908.1 hypothetical protein EHQ93_02530 [Leptospira meyeri]
MLSNVDTFRDFFGALRSKECVKFKKWLGKNFYYVLDEGNIHFSFWQNKNYFDSYKNMEICDFFYNQTIYNQAIAQEESEFKHQRLPSERILNSHAIEIYDEKDNKTLTYTVMLRFHSCLSDRKLKASFPTELYFNCSEKLPLQCTLERALSSTEPEY